MGMVLLRPLRYTITRHSASTSMAIIAIARRRATPPAAPIAAWIAAAAVAAISLVVSVMVTVPVVPGLVIRPKILQRQRDQRMLYADCSNLHSRSCLLILLQCV